MSIESMRAKQAMQRRVQSRKSQEAAFDDQIGRVHVIMGEFMTGGVGESVITVNFPVHFVEKPIVTGGAELAPDGVLTDGSFPTHSLTVVAWAYDEKTPNTIYYIGATLACRTTGAEGTNLIMNWKAEGRAITNPSGANDTTDSTV